MVIYRRAGFRWAAVDKRATASTQVGRYSRERMTAKRLVSALYLIIAVRPLPSCSSSAYRPAARPRVCSEFSLFDPQDKHAKEVA